MNWCAGHPDVHVINMSLSTSENSNGGSMLEIATGCIVAAGKFGPAEQTMGAPRAAREVVTVGALEPASDRTQWPTGYGEAMAPYSSRGTVGSSPMSRCRAVALRYPRQTNRATLHI